MPVGSHIVAMSARTVPTAEAMATLLETMPIVSGVMCLQALHPRSPLFFHGTRCRRFRSAPIQIPPVTVCHFIDMLRVDNKISADSIMISWNTLSACPKVDSRDISCSGIAMSSR